MEFIASYKVDSEWKWWYYDCLPESLAVTTILLDKHKYAFYQVMMCVLIFCWLYLVFFCFFFFLKVTSNLKVTHNAGCWKGHLSSSRLGRMALRGQRGIISLFFMAVSCGSWRRDQGKCEHRRLSVISGRCAVQWLYMLLPVADTHFTHTPHTFLLLFAPSLFHTHTHTHTLAVISLWGDGA